MARISIKPKSIPARALFDGNSSTTVTEISSDAASSNTSSIKIIAGETITAFTPVWVSSGKLYLASSNPAEYIALEAGDAGSEIDVVRLGVVNHSFTSVGDLWLNAGAASNTPQIESGKYLQKLGKQETATRAFIDIQTAYKVI